MKSTLSPVDALSTKRTSKFGWCVFKPNLNNLLEVYSVPILTLHSLGIVLFSDYNERDKRMMKRMSL